MSSASRWYVAALQPGREDLAEVNLRRQGFGVWTPRQIKIVRHARRRQERRVAFFPGYTFVSLDLDRQRWRSINGTAGVRSLIMRGERPAHCPPGLVEQLQTLTDAAGLFTSAADMQAGDAVRVTAGPFAELAGVLCRLDGDGRARVLLRIMQGEVAVTLDTRDLVPASA